MKKLVSTLIVIFMLLLTALPFGTVGLEQLNKTIYVDDDGTADYIKIQDAVDNASEGDTVFVYSGTYYEHVIINNSILLIGENKTTTIINGENKGTNIEINADRVTVSGFSIIRSCNRSGNMYAGILVKSSDNKIYENILYNHYRVGIDVVSGSNNEFLSNNISANCCFRIIDVDNNKIYDNAINSGDKGIYMHNSSNNEIYGNIIKSKLEREVNNGIYITYHSNSNIIKNNIISNFLIGILIDYSLNIQVERNHFEGNYYNDIALQWGYFCKITCNNFMSNTKEREIDYEWAFTTKFDSNYWNGPRTVPKFVFGIIYIPYIDIFGPFLFDAFPFPVFRIDWHPAQEPYDIPGGVNV